MGRARGSLSWSGAIGCVVGLCFVSAHIPLVPQWPRWSWGANAKQEFDGPGRPTYLVVRSLLHHWGTGILWIGLAVTPHFCMDTALLPAFMAWYVRPFSSWNFFTLDRREAKSLAPYTRCQFWGNKTASIRMRTIETAKPAAVWSSTT